MNGVQKEFLYIREETGRQMAAYKQQLIGRQCSGYLANECMSKGSLRTERLLKKRYIYLANGRGTKWSKIICQLGECKLELCEMIQVVLFYKLQSTDQQTH